MPAPFDRFAPSPSDSRRAEVEALRRSLAREGGAGAGASAFDSAMQPAPASFPGVDTAGQMPGTAGQMLDAAGQALRADFAAQASSGARVGERELRDAVRRAALSRLKGRGGDEAGAGVLVSSEASVRAGEAGVCASEMGVGEAGARIGGKDVCGAHSVVPALGAHSIPAAAAAAASAASVTSAASPAPVAAAPEADRTMREYVSELLNPKQDRGANVLTELDHEAIAQGKGRHYAKTGGHARAALAFLLEFLLIFVIALALIFPLRAFVAEYYYIPSGSMEDTLQVDDRILSEKVSYYFDTPKQGQIVTFNGTKEEEGQMLIKRVIAVGGQTVDLRDGAVYVDGEKLDEPYTEGKQSKPLSNSNGITYPYKVPEGEIWVMGDNRTNSLDSRVFGSVPVENVTGHAFWRYWPLSSFGSLE